LKTYRKTVAETTQKAPVALIKGQYCGYCDRYSEDEWAEFDEKKGKLHFLAATLHRYLQSLATAVHGFCNP